MLDWVRRIPGRFWDRDAQAWVATGLGPDPDRILARMGFTVTGTDGAPTSVNHLANVVTESSTQTPAHRLPAGVEPDETLAIVWPRLIGQVEVGKSVPAAATWYQEPGCWVVQIADLTDPMRAHALAVPAPMFSLAQVLHAKRGEGRTDEKVAQNAAVLARSDKVIADAARGLGLAVPDWFDVDLFAFQEAGALAASAGHTLIADEPGLGKTFQSLAACAISGAQRIVAVVPPVVVTNWANEVTRTGMLDQWGPGTIGRDGFDTRIVRFRAGRKEPELPARGVAIVSDSLLVHRPQLMAELQAWAPGAVIVDEAHRHKSFDSLRSNAARTLAEASAGLRIAVTGTPVISSAVDLAALLAITGHLDTVFGGHSAFLETYCKQNFWGGWESNPHTADDLRRRLEAEVWVRRTKAQVLPDLPPKLRTATWLDVDLAEYRQAHAEVAEKIGEWIESFIAKHRRVPTTAATAPMGELPELDDWASNNLSLVSLLRQGAGRCKVPAAAEIIKEHVESTTDRPLTVWVHHKDVGDAMIEAASEAVGADKVRVIRGGTSADARGRIVADFQEGKIPVLIASITAAGVGVTLTRSSDVLFVEADWTNANITQAEDRSARIGQIHPVSITTLIAAGTLDNRIQRVLEAKHETIDVLTPGADTNPVVDGLDNDRVSKASDVIVEIALPLIAKAAKTIRV